MLLANTAAPSPGLGSQVSHRPNPEKNPHTACAIMPQNGAAMPPPPISGAPGDNNGLKRASAVSYFCCDSLFPVFFLQRMYRIVRCLKLPHGMQM
ncbi:hypothetical protein L596_003353 [Steinernema carpocapsae]|uniref:Uncharacterized protein n=1 Tax=Steinernema carpocapsae TaxID=34508 RepID=A0A4U8UW97_STECR|nr:hypothetical protein L596_003353 [Steinernema carpocapsae]